MQNRIKQLHQQFDELIDNCHRAGLTEYRTFSDIVDNWSEFHKKHKTLKNMPQIMLRLLEKGSLEVTDEELRSYYNLPRDRQHEIVFILYWLERLTPKQIIDNLNFGDTKLTETKKANRIHYIIRITFPNRKKVVNCLIVHPHWNYLEGDWNYAKYPHPENYTTGSHKLVE
ncbi:MAG: hypothetical protein ACFFDT_25325 [Candidatus Hodarchaeota archaeon]